MLQQSHVSVTVNVSAACGLYAAFFSLVILVLQCNWLGRVLHAWLQVREPQRLPFIRLLCLWWLHDWKLWRSVGCVSTVTSPAFSYLQRQQWTHPPTPRQNLLACSAGSLSQAARERAVAKGTLVHISGSAWPCKRLKCTWSVLLHYILLDLLCQHVLPHISPWSTGRPFSSYAFHWM